jgi:methyltransferase (TIGR00027 family)
MQKVDFSAVRWGSVEWTNLVTLYLRACESRVGQPILGDRYAAEAVDRIDYDWNRMRWAAAPWGNQFLVALRAKQFDEWATDFLRRHQDSLVLHLGCGLDSRAFRVNLPNAVGWFDLDQPGVIALRRKLYDERDHYRMIGSSVSDPAWLDGVPSGGSALIVAEGLLMYLTESEVRDLLARLIAQFDGGEVLFDTLSPISPTISKLFQGGIVKWGIRDAREMAQWNPRLHFLEQTSSIAGYQRIAPTPQRLMFRLVNATPMGRYDMLNRFAF